MLKVWRLVPGTSDNVVMSTSAVATFEKAKFGMLPSEGAALGLFLVPASWLPRFQVGWLCDFYTRDGRKFKGEIVKLEGDRVTFKAFGRRYAFKVVEENRTTFVLGGC